MARGSLRLEIEARGGGALERGGGFATVEGGPRLAREHMCDWFRPRRGPLWPRPAPLRAAKGMVPGYRGPGNAWRNDTALVE